MSMNRWGVSIIRHDNGYLLALEPSEKEGEITAVEVYEDDEDDPLKGIESVLWRVIDHFGMMGSRYDKERIVIRREPGDKSTD